MSKQDTHPKLEVVTENSADFTNVQTVNPLANRKSATLLLVHLYFHKAI